MALGPNSAAVGPGRGRASRSAGALGGRQWRGVVVVLSRHRHLIGLLGPAHRCVGPTGGSVRFRRHAGCQHRCCVRYRRVGHRSHRRGSERFGPDHRHRTFWCDLCTSAQQQRRDDEGSCEHHWQTVFAASGRCVRFGQGGKGPLGMAGGGWLHCFHSLCALPIYRRSKVAVKRVMDTPVPRRTETLQTVPVGSRRQTVGCRAHGPVAIREPACPDQVPMTPPSFLRIATVALRGRPSAR